MKRIPHLLNRAVLALPVVRRAQANTRIEFMAAQQSLEDDLDREIALSNRLGKRLGLTELDVVAERCRMGIDLDTIEQLHERKAQLHADFFSIIDRSFHPSNGGES